VSSSPADIPALRDYEISSRLAEGSDSVVYAGRHRLTGHPVALQRIDPRLAEAVGFVDRLGNAARRVAALRNPHLEGVYDLVVEDGVYLVLELVGGPSLRELSLAGQPLPPATALAAVDDVLNGLETAHAEGIVHGDIRPERVLATPQGVAKLGGFAESQARLVLPDHPGAKRPGYSSPERLAGMQPDARSDLYATAALASEMLTGSIPSPGRIGPAALPAISEVLQRALSVDAARRYASATELRAALVGAVATSLGPSWRLASDLGFRATEVLRARGDLLPTPPPVPLSTTGVAPPAGPVSGFSTPPPPGATVLQVGTPPPSIARPPAAPPAAYLPPPEPRMRAAITELDGDEHRRRWLKPLLIVLGVLAIGAGAAVAVVELRSTSETSSNAPLTVGSDVALTVTPKAGGCNTDFGFVATGSLTGKGQLLYRWERSDGQQSSDIPVTITNQGSFRFTITWRVIGRQKLDGTMTFRLVSPTSRVATAAISYNCP